MRSKTCELWNERPPNAMPCSTDEPVNVRFQKSKTFSEAGRPAVKLAFGDPCIRRSSNKKHCESNSCRPSGDVVPAIVHAMIPAVSIITLTQNHPRGAQLEVRMLNVCSTEFSVRAAYTLRKFQTHK